MLGIERLDCGYGALHAVHEVSFEVPSGSVFALLGPNGAGKTSTIMAIMGHVDIFSGRILFDGADITTRRAVDRVGLGIALVPEGRHVFPFLTVQFIKLTGHFITSISFCGSIHGKPPFFEILLLPRQPQKRRLTHSLYSSYCFYRFDPDNFKVFLLSPDRHF